MTTDTTARHRRLADLGKLHCLPFLYLDNYCLNVPDTVLCSAFSVYTSVHILIGITQRRDQDRTMSTSYVRSLNVPDIVCVIIFCTHFCSYNHMQNPKTGPRQNDVCILPKIVTRVTRAHSLILCEALRLLARQCL